MLTAILVTSKQPRDPNALPATIANAESPTLQPGGLQADVVKPPVVIEETIAHGPSRGNDATMPPTASKEALSAVGIKVRYFGDYELLDEIARGGMGVVYKARQVSLNRIVALKMILTGQLAGKDDVQRFHAEAEAAANLDHSGIVPIYEVGEHDGKHYFSMALIDGGSLASKLKDGPLPPQAAAEYTQKVTAAIAFAHDRGVIHRDLKPANVLLDRNSEPKVTDFGLAKQVQGDSHLTTTGQILGTPSYMPPEQAAGQIAEIGPAADIYSLGAILYALLTGRPPFQSDNPMDTLLQVLERDPVPPRQLNPNLPADLETICLKCLEKTPVRRYPCAQALGEELGRFLRGEPILARPINSFERGWRWCKRKPAIASLVGTIALLVLIGTTVATIAAFKFKSLAEQERQTASNEREASLAAEVARKTAETERNLARTANERSLDALAASLYQQAAALRISAKPGRRWAALDLLKSAEELRARKRVQGSEPTELTTKEPALAVALPSRADLRTEAVAALLTQDARPIWQKVWSTSATPASISPGSQIAAVPWLDQSNVAGSGPLGIRLVNLADGTVNRALANPNMWGHTVAISPDGRTLAVPPRPASSQMLPPVQLWDLSAGTVLKDLKFPQEEMGKTGPTSYSTINDLAFSPSGRFLVAFRNDSVAVWDVETGSARSEATKSNLPTMYSFGRERDLLAYRTGVKEITLWDLESGQPALAVEPPMLGSQHFALTSKGELIALFGAINATSSSGSIMFWNPWTKKQQGSIRLSAETLISAMSFSPDDKLLVAADNGGTIFCFDVTTNTEWFRLPRAQKGMTKSFAWSADGSRLCSAGMDGSLRCWELMRDSPVRTVRLKSPLVGKSFALHPRGRQMAVASTSSAGSVFLLNRDSGQVEQELASGNKPVSRSEVVAWRVFYRDDGQQLALTGQKLAVAWDLATGNEVVRWVPDPEVADELTSAAFADDGGLLASGLIANQKTGVVWRVATRERLWQSPENYVQVRFSRDGRLLAVTDRFATARGGPRFSIVELATGKEPFSRDKQIASVTLSGAPLFSPDGQWIAAFGGTSASWHEGISTGQILGGENAHVIVWHVEAGEQLWEVRGSEAPTAYTFSPDSHMLAVGYRDGAAQLWDLQTKDLVFQWKEHTMPITHLVFSEDGSEIASAEAMQGNSFSQFRFLNLTALRQQLATCGLDW